MPQDASWTPCCQRSQANSYDDPRTVVLVGPRCEAATEPYEEVVACIDGSAISQSVTALAGTWAAAFGARARLLHVTDPATAIAKAPSIASRYLQRLAARIGEPTT